MKKIITLLALSLLLLNSFDCKSQSIQSDEPLYPIRENGQYGYMNKNGEVVISPRYDRAGYFSEGLACVKIDGKLGFIDKSGNNMIEPQFDRCYDFNEGYALVFEKHKQLLIDKTGKTIYSIHGDKGDLCEFHEGYARVSTWHIWFGKVMYKYKYIDYSGRTVLKVKHSFAGYCFSDGLAVFFDITNELDHACCRIHGYKEGYIDKTGRMIIEPKFYFADDFKEGLALVQETYDGKYGFIGTTGEFVIEPQFDELTTGFYDGLARVVVNGKTSFIDKSGNYVIKNLEYENISVFKEGFSIVRAIHRGKAGFIDKTGSLVIEMQFDDADYFRDGLAKVMIGDKMAYIDTTGAIIWMEK